ncbi:MAG: hypothetical protein MK077_04150 [Phycisphaerales bacterium]|nr:hypothetical protein [Phycisphaerales bacterium]
MLKRLFQVMSVIPVLGLGCQSAPSGPTGPPASPAKVILSPVQASAVLSSMQEAVQPPTGQPLALLPATGQRWVDVPRAVSSAGKRPSAGFAVVSSTVDVETASFRIRTLDGWPGWIKATHADGVITCQVIMGPDPSHPGAKAQAKRIEAEVLASLQRWGRRPELPAQDADNVVTAADVQDRAQSATNK